jgi:hypothetical protein
MSLCNGVKVNGADQLQQIGIFPAYDGCVPVLKEVSMASVALIDVYHLAGQKFTHIR